MTSPVVTVAPDTALDDAAQLLIRHSVSTLPVSDIARGLVGVVTETDIFRALALRMGIGLSPTGRLDVGHVPMRIADIAHPADIWVKPDDDVSFCLQLMVRNDGKSLPVVEHGHVVGIISRREAISALSAPSPVDIDVAKTRVGQGQLPELLDALASS
jgi:CBS domain-containing protein